VEWETKKIKNHFASHPFSLTLELQAFFSFSPLFPPQVRIDSFVKRRHGDSPRGRSIEGALAGTHALRRALGFFAHPAARLSCRALQPPHCCLFDDRGDAFFFVIGLN